MAFRVKVKFFSKVYTVLLNVLIFLWPIWTSLTRYLSFTTSTPATMFSLLFFSLKTPRLPDSELLQPLLPLPRRFFPQMPASLPHLPQIDSLNFPLIRPSDHLPYVYHSAYHHIGIYAFYLFCCSFSQMKHKFNVGKYLACILLKLACPHHENTANTARVILAPNHACSVKRNHSQHSKVGIFFLIHILQMWKTK